MWILYKDGFEIERHSTKLACIIAAYEHHLIWRGFTDFGPLEELRFAENGVEIKEEPDE